MSYTDEKGARVSRQAPQRPQEGSPTPPCTPTPAPHLNRLRPPCPRPPCPRPPCPHPPCAHPVRAHPVCTRGASRTGPRIVFNLWARGSGGERRPYQHSGHNLRFSFKFRKAPAGGTERSEPARRSPRPEQPETPSRPGRVTRRHRVSFWPPPVTPQRSVGPVLTNDLRSVHPLPLPPGQCPPRSETGSAAVSVRAVWSRTHGSPEAGGTTRRPHNRGPGGAWPPPRVRGPREGRAASLQLPRPLPQVPRRRPSCQPSRPPSERGGGGGGGAHPLRLVPGKTRARRVASLRLYGAAGREGGAGSSSVHSTPGVSQGCPPPCRGPRLE